MTVEEIIEQLKYFPLSLKVSICSEKWEYFEIKSFGFDDLGKTVEITVSTLDDDEY